MKDIKCRWCKELAIYNYGGNNKYCYQHNTEYICDFENEYLCKFTCDDKVIK